MSNLSLIANEKQTVRCLIEDPSLCSVFDKNYFLSPVGRALFDTINDLFTKNLPVTRDHLVEEGSRLSAEIDYPTVDLLLNDQAFSIDAMRTLYAPRLKSDYAKKILSDVLLKDILVEATSKDTLDVEKVRGLMDQMRDAIDLVEGKESRLMNLDQAGRRYEQGLRARSSRGGYPTGDSHLDKMLTSGFQPKNMSVFFGATGLGKSAAAMHLCDRNINKQIPAALFSLEMDLMSSFDRLAARRLKIPTMSLLPNPETNIVEPFIIDAVAREMERLRRNDSFFFAEEEGLSIRDVESMIKEAKRRAREDYFIIYIDLMTMLSDFAGEDAPNYELGMNHLLEMARRQRVHIVNVVQANRTADSSTVTSIEQINRFRPRRNTIKNAQVILERCRNQISVFRPKFYAEQLFPEAQETRDMLDIFEMATLKQTQGRVGQIIRYIYDGSTFSLTPYIEARSETAVAAPSSAAPPGRR